MKKCMFLAFICIVALVACACSPAYTWGYAPAIHPKSVTAYIYAVMAEENGENEAALEYYDKALAYTRSEKVKAERKALAERMKTH